MKKTVITTLAIMGMFVNQQAMADHDCDMTISWPCHVASSSCDVCPAGTPEEGAILCVFTTDGQDIDSCWVSSNDPGGDCKDEASVICKYTVSGKDCYGNAYSGPSAGQATPTSCE